MRTRLLSRVVNRPVLIWFGLAMASAVAVALLGGFFYEVYTRDPAAPDINNLPIYPGAYSLSTRDNDVLAFKADDKGHFIQTDTRVVGKITDYQTNAKPEDVFTFYRKVMPEHGWPTPDQLDDGSLAFIYASYRKGFLLGGTVKLLTVTVGVKTTGNGVAFVELKTGP